ncbi:unnamed protein product, partial [Effrenium voratum]
MGPATAPQRLPRYGCSGAPRNAPLRPASGLRLEKPCFGKVSGRRAPALARTAAGPSATSFELRLVELWNHFGKKLLRSFPDVRGNFVWVNAKTGAKSEQDVLQTLRIAKTREPDNCEALRRMGTWLSEEGATIENAMDYLKSIMTDEGLGLDFAKQALTSAEGKKYVAACEFFNTKGEQDKDAEELSGHVEHFLQFLTEDGEKKCKRARRLALCAARLYLLAASFLEQSSICQHPDQWAPKVDAKLGSAAAFKKKPTAKRLAAFMEEAAQSAAAASTSDRRKRAAADDSSEKPVSSSSASADSSASSSKKKKKAAKSKKEKKAKAAKAKQSQKSKKAGKKDKAKASTCSEKAKKRREAKAKPSSDSGGRGARAGFADSDSSEAPQPAGWPEQAAGPLAEWSKEDSQAAAVAWAASAPKLAAGSFEPAEYKDHIELIPAAVREALDVQIRADRSRPPRRVDELTAAYYGIFAVAELFWAAHSAA